VTANYVYSVLNVPRNATAFPWRACNRESLEQKYGLSRLLRDSSDSLADLLDQLDGGGLKMQDRKRKDQKRTIVGKCRTGKWRTRFGVKSEGGKCGTGKWRTRKWRTGNCRTKYLSGKCRNNVGNKRQKRS